MREGEGERERESFQLHGQGVACSSNTKLHCAPPELHRHWNGVSPALVVRDQRSSV